MSIPRCYKLPLCNISMVFQVFLVVGLTSKIGNVNRVSQDGCFYGRADPRTIEWSDPSATLVTPKLLTKHLVLAGSRSRYASPGLAANSK